MKDKRPPGFRRTGLECLLASIVLALLTFVSFHLHAGPALAALLFFFLVILISLWAGFVSTVFACVVAALCFIYFFTQPLYSLRMSAPVEIAALIAFSSTILIISGLLSRVREQSAILQQNNEQLQTEMTERRRAEEKIRQSEAELRRILDLTPQLVAAFGHDRKRLYANRHALDYFGVTLEEWQGISDRFWFYHPDDRERMARDVYVGLASDGPHQFEARLRRKDGAYRWFLFRDSPLRDEQGLIIRWYVTATDIEDRKRVEEERRAQAALLHITHDTVFVMDMEGVIKYWNRGAEERYGWTAEHALGRVVHELLKTVFPGPLEEIRAEVSRAGRWEGEILHSKKDGTQVMVASRWALQRDERGAPMAILETNNDITERKRAEEALRLSNAYNRSLIEASPDPLVTIGPDGEITDVNAATEAATGRSRGELVGTDFCDYFTEPAKARAGYEQVFRDGMVRDFPLELRHRDGGVMSVMYNASVYRDESGRVIGVFAAARDITLRKQAEEALRESEANLNRAQEIAHIGSWHLDVTRNRLTWSDEVFRIFGVSFGTALTYEAFIDRVHPGDRESVHNAWAAALHGAPYDIEHRIVVGGDLKWVRERAQVEFNEEGNATSGIGTVQDITERKTAEAALRQSEAYLAEGQRLTGTGSWAFDLASNKYIYTSEEIFRIFEMDAQEGLLNREAISRHIHPEDWERVNESFEKSLREKVDTLSEFRILLPSGTAKHLQTIRHPVMNDAGDVVKLVGTVIDVTERKRAEQERERLRQLEANLAHINRVSMMGELAASVAHEVNQPLSGVVVNGNACLRWLAGDSPNLEEAREAVRRIVRDGKRAGDVIARIRALATKTAPAKERLDMNEAIREVVTFAGDELRKNSVAVRTEFVDDLSPVLGDRVQLQQVVLNLVMNGVEAMSSVEERPRELIVRTRNDDVGQVRVTVQDSGIGLDPQSMERMFDAFYTTKHGGMGMGLSISRSIIQNHGGKLWAVANEGPGISVQFTIPNYQ